MNDWYDAARRHIKANVVTQHTSFGRLMADWFNAGAPSAPGSVPVATTAANGTVKKAATVASPTDAATALTSLQALITNMRAAGQIV